MVFQAVAEIKSILCAEKSFRLQFYPLDALSLPFGYDFGCRAFTPLMHGFPGCCWNSKYLPNHLLSMQKNWTKIYEIIHIMAIIQIFCVYIFYIFLLYNHDWFTLMTGKEGVIFNIFVFSFSNIFSKEMHEISKKLMQKLSRFHAVSKAYLLHDLEWEQSLKIFFAYSLII